MKGINFLKNLYKLQCQNGDYVILSVKGPQIKWRDIYIKYHSNTITNRLTEFFQEYPHSKYDLYFSTVPFKDKRRRIGDVIESKFLFADLDEKTDKELKAIKNSELPPRYLWESSPGKYQCLVEIDRYVDPNRMDQLNKGLESYYQADSCGDIVHVIRIPGTTNHKYKNNPLVKPAQVMGKPIRLKNAIRLLGAAKPKEEKAKVKVGDLNNSERKIYAKYNIPQKVRDLLAIDDISDLDRSSTIWYIENKLTEVGLDPNEIILLVKNSLFNKYKGRPDEDSRLRKELDKIIGGKINLDLEKAHDSKLKVDSYQDIMGNCGSFPGWLIEGFWGRRSHGIVAGQPKVFKSTFVQDLAISVASGTPFLGKYPVLEPGPVIMVQNENADWIMRDRTEKLIHHRGVVGRVKVKKSNKLNIKFAPELPITFINQQGFMLDNESHRNQLEELIKEIKPVLVIFDPLYLMFGGDMNNASDLNPVLQWALKLKNDYKTGVMLIHHYNKGGNATQTRGGQKMAGSYILHGWVESAWYLKRPDLSDEEEEAIEVLDDTFDKQSTEPSKIIMDREFRLAGQFPQIELKLQMGAFGDPYYHVDVATPGKGEPVVTKEGRAKVLRVLMDNKFIKDKAELVELTSLTSSKINVILDLMKDQVSFHPERGYSLRRNKGGS